jgi:ribonuclease G
MGKEILINCHPRENRVAVLVDGRLDQFFFERQENQGPLGNIYKGKVTNILPGLGAAFVDIGLGKDGFLPMGETAESSSLWREFIDEESELEERPRSKNITIKKLLRREQEILVQVTKEQIGAKGPRLTTQISLPGRFLVLMPGEKRIGVSRKIASRPDRQRLRGLLKEIKVPEGIGLIVRTAALSSTTKALKKDVKYLVNIWKAIQQQDKRLSAPALVHEEIGLVMKSIRDSLLTDVDRIITDSRQEYKKISRFLNMVLPAAASKIVFYKERQPLFEKYGLEEEVNKLFQPRIWLKCGGSVVFNQAEALVAVDVNTGKHKGKKDQEATVLKTNLEAAEEVAKQLRLRNVGGIIVIDFIDMDSKKHEKQVMAALSRELKKDRAKTKVYPFSELGLIEMTRQREQESFLHQVYECCPFCAGQGVVKSIFSLVLELERKLLAAIGNRKGVKRFRIEAHPHLARYLLEEGWDNLRHLARHHHIRLSIIDNASLKFQEYIIWALSQNGQEKV